MAVTFELLTSVTFLCVGYNNFMALMVLAFPVLTIKKENSTEHSYIMLI